eukprot:401647-Pyramimonas_sp.AAC.1
MVQRSRGPWTRDYQVVGGMDRRDLRTIQSVPTRGGGYMSASRRTNRCVGKASRASRLSFPHRL